MAIADLYWVDAALPGKLAVAPKPRAGDWLEDEIRSWKMAGVDVVVCLLRDDEIAELDLSLESAFCQSHAIEFLRFPIQDRGIPPNRPEANELINGIAGDLMGGRNVLIHCRAGIGRTGLVAACVLIDLGVDPHQSLQLVSRARGTIVPDTDEQRDWILSFTGGST